jgi:hypothetical protein
LTTSLLFLCACRDVLGEIFKEKNNKILNHYFNNLDLLSKKIINASGEQLQNDAFIKIVLQKDISQFLNRKIRIIDNYQNFCL